MATATSSQNKTSIKEIKEIAIAIAVKDFPPAIITEEFVKQNNIVNSDWQLSQEPLSQSNRAQLSFDSGVTILAQPKGVAFIERVKNDDNQLQVQAVAEKCVTKLTGVEYQGIKLETKRLIPIPNNDAARSYLTEFLIASGGWQNYGQAPVKAGINFLYDLGRCTLNLGIGEATITQENKEAGSKKDTGGLLFSGTFRYAPFTGEKLSKAKQAIKNSQQDWQEFNQIVDKVFLNQDNNLLQKTLFE